MYASVCMYICVSVHVRVYKCKCVSVASSLIGDRPSKVTLGTVRTPASATSAQKTSLALSLSHYTHVSTIYYLHYRYQPH